MSLPPFTFAEIEERLDDIFIELDENIIQQFCQYDIETQDFLLSLIEKTNTTNSGLAYQLGQRLPKAWSLMDRETIELWLEQAIDAFDSKGLYLAVEKLDELESVAKLAEEKLTGISFDEISGVLEHFVTGLNGRRLALDTHKHCYTDTETLFLPSMLNRFADKNDNFILYKCMTVHLWAQCWFGSWNIEIENALQQYDNPQQALAWFHLLEALRLDACIERELPGIHRQMQRLCDLLSQPTLAELHNPHTVNLRQKTATAQHSLDILNRVYSQPLPEHQLFTGQMKPDAVRQKRDIRLAREKELFRQVIAHLMEEKTGKKAAELNDEERRAIEATEVPDPDMPNGMTFRLELDGEPVQPPDGVESLMDSIIQDLSMIPEDYLVAAGDGGYKLTENEEKSSAKDVWGGTYHEEGATLHKEWDYKRQRYKKNWCAVRELDVTTGSPGFVEETLKKYSGQIKSLRRTFEILRGEDKTLKKQPYGDDIDVDALVEAWADVQSGHEMSPNIFTKMHKEERNIAVIFMVDMSGSTKGWINDAERESLVLLCEALETLGDRYAIYGFTGNTRKRCEVYRIKRFEDDYDATCKGRIANISPQDYTRLGVFIRHFTELFNDVDAKTKILITISDGKPEDYDGYRGEYGIEDTRMALLEARQNGVHPFCITIDSQARDYLPGMYGRASYIVIDDVKQLPLKVADIYRHITS